MEQPHLTWKNPFGLQIATVHVLKFACTVQHQDQTALEAFYFRAERKSVKIVKSFTKSDHMLLQGSYRQDCVKDFSRTFKKTFLLFSRTENLRKMLIKFYFGNARVHY